MKAEPEMKEQKNSRVHLGEEVCLGEEIARLGEPVIPFLDS